MEDWKKAAALDDITGTGLPVVIGDEEILLVRSGDQVYALSYLCSHQDKPLEGGYPEKGAWVCPHHGARFDLASGDALSMPAGSPVETFPVRVEEGEVWVKTEP